MSHRTDSVNMLGGRYISVLPFLFPNRMLKNIDKSIIKIYSNNI